MSIKYNAMSEMATLNEHIRLLEKRKRNKGGLTEDQKEVYKVDLEELIRLERIDRAEDDVLFFMYEYFSDMKNPENEQNLIPAGVSINEAPKFHAELCKILDEVSSVNLTARIGWAAPRGHAKSAYLSNAFSIHQICFKKRKYILVISETDTSAKKFIEWISQQLKCSQSL